MMNSSQVLIQLSQCACASSSNFLPIKLFCESNVPAVRCVVSCALDKETAFILMPNVQIA